MRKTGARSGAENTGAGQGGSRTAARTLRGGWRLGLVALGAAVALTAGVAVLPLPTDGGSEKVSATGGTAAQAAAKAPDCEAPEKSLRAASVDGPTIEKIKARGKLVAGVDQNSFRWGYRNPASGNLEGFDIDIVKAIAKELLGSEDKVIYRAIPTSQRIPMLESGKVDIVVRTMTVNCDRIKKVAFSHAYFQAGQQVLAPKESKITGYDDSLQGKKVCMARGSTALDAMTEKSHGAIFNTPELLVPNQLDCLVRLQLGQVDAIVTDNALAASQAAQDPAIELKGTEPFTTEYYAVATNKSASDLVRRINKVLAAYGKGPWQKSYDEWLSKDLKGLTGPPAPKFLD
ncbi:glutamate ABC transporter substrate-binding protein [Streptomyces sp. NBC_00237]|uniref:glutamate ABC transporter substrate-binding protein n=1 Tax=Streptomyces sp. NBC_00237 TaxID=2975687 RepID=UPI00225159D4|nr:glutamate ABC transporter substrate-binding protein [Streptomyces sp. NBC_00237]MCX5201183.1 glutamate ABC transporter substrate-binding protein [Streptomyces sp. NBC_00237]